ncbi:SURF1 family protein [Methylorubrum thiocyanatum]|uniref:SURF1-like protein n=1 Tax=Methylorubrum thiocyanatum TaxID=47958 RepID=A0AA40S286_9HYPH|nr:SURF1 family protein [Methylorubrum thiocyanatum]MBA8913238.1 surfeit locus 1 family protein [Methylorubrum thiocyanatum]GJE80356.1 putative SURF1-like protein [Methylorubrum thiocyanatum]
MLARIVLVLAGLALTGVFLGLGTWQVERRVWKLALIDRVEARIHAEPVPAPGPEEWAGLTAASAEYRRVRLTGRFAHDRATLVQALSERGAGFWVLVPLVTDRGFTVLVNRGFVPTEARERSARAAGEPEGEVTLTGLLRLSEPGGGFLRRNDPAADRWYSRDVAAIATARGIDGPTAVAPYFVDADGAPNPGGLPMGGLTVVAFHNNHLVYALTWYALALMTAGALIFVLRQPSAAR